MGKGQEQGSFFTFQSEDQGLASVLTGGAGREQMPELGVPGWYIKSSHHETRLSKISKWGI